jgi:hypothetical protein
VVASVRPKPLFADDPPSSDGCATTPAVSRSPTTGGGRRAPGRAAGWCSADICGGAALGQGFACSTGEGRFLLLDGGPAREERVPGLAFDNHLVRI